MVIHLGCGLDARITRVQPFSSIAWFDIDYPDVISLRKEFYSETNEYKMIASSITAQNWLETIPADRPANIGSYKLRVIEGLQVQCFLIIFV